MPFVDILDRIHSHSRHSYHKYSPGKTERMVVAAAVSVAVVAAAAVDSRRMKGKGIQSKCIVAKLQCQHHRKLEEKPGVVLFQVVATASVLNCLPGKQSVELPASDILPHLVVSTVVVAAAVGSVVAVIAVAAAGKLRLPDTDNSKPLGRQSLSDKSSVAGKHNHC